MLKPVVVYVNPELLHEVEIQALKEGYDLNAVTEMSYENYLSLGYDDEELKRIHGEERYKEIEAEVERLEAEWEAGKEERDKWQAREKAKWEKRMEVLLAEMSKGIKTNKKPVTKLELSTELIKPKFKV